MGITSMNDNIIILITSIISVLASSGFWAFIMQHNQKKSAADNMLIGLGHDRIVFLGMLYIERGWILKDEFENLNDYLYKPYKTLGGNGSAERIMKDVYKLEIRNNPPKE